MDFEDKDVRCAACNNWVHPATGHYFSPRFALCGRHAFEFSKWYRLRMLQMNVSFKNKKTGVVVSSFSDAAAASIIGDSMGG